MQKIGKKGDISIEGAIGAILFFFGFYIFLILYDVIGNQMLFPILENAEKVTYGAPAKLLILLVPVIMAIMGIVVIIRSFTRPPPPQQYGYY